MLEEATSRLAALSYSAKERVDSFEKFVARRPWVMRKCTEIGPKDIVEAYLHDLIELRNEIAVQHDEGVHYTFSDEVVENIIWRSLQMSGAPSDGIESSSFVRSVGASEHVLFLVGLERILQIVRGYEGKLFRSGMRLLETLPLPPTDSGTKISAAGLILEKRKRAPPSENDFYVEVMKSIGWIID